MSCPICKSLVAINRQHPSRDAYVVGCPDCGDFTISRAAMVNLRAISDGDLWKVSSWINEIQTDIVSSSDIDRALSTLMPNLTHRVDRMLRWLHKKFPPGLRFIINTGIWEHYKNVTDSSLVSTQLVPVGWNRNVAEMEFMLTEVLCNEMGLLVCQNGNEYQISPKGLLYLEGRSGQANLSGFCAMWFNEEVTPLWMDAIGPAIRVAGYEPLRIDGKHHNGKIDDEIVASIRASKFVVADFTGQRGGVYYEAGFAHGLGLPVIFMCREADVADLHFDIRQYNCILWKPDELEDAKARLKNRILATLGQGPLKVE